MRLIKAGLLLITLLSFSAQAATWVKYDTTSSSDTTYYYDVDSIKFGKFDNGKKYIRVWEESRYTANQSYKENYCSDSSSRLNLYSSTNSCHKFYRSTKGVSYYDCWNNRLNTGATYYYNSDGSSIASDGDYVTTGSSVSWGEAIPGTVGEGKLQEICRNFNHRLK